MLGGGRIPMTGPVVASLLANEARTRGIGPQLLIFPGPNPGFAGLGQVHHHPFVGRQTSYLKELRGAVDLRRVQSLILILRTNDPNYAMVCTLRNTGELMFPAVDVLTTDSTVFTVIDRMFRNDLGCQSPWIDVQSSYVWKTPTSNTAVVVASTTTHINHDVRHSRMSNVHFVRLSEIGREIRSGRSGFRHCFTELISEVFAAERIH